MAFPTMIGVLLDADFDYGVEVLEGVRTFARTRPDWHVMPIPAAQEGLLTRLARSGDLHGVVGAFLSDRWIESRLPPTLKVVNAANLSPITSVCSVVPDDFAVGRLAARHLLDLGYRNMLVVADRATYASHLRREGFLAAAAAEPECHVEDLTAEASGSSATYRLETVWQAWLETAERETAVFCVSDHLACRFWSVCRACAPEVQARVCAIVGVGDAVAARVISGLDLTSVPLPGRTIGHHAAARLERLLAGGTGVCCERIAPEGITVRGSTSRYASADPVVARAMGIALQTLDQHLGVDEIARRTGVSRRTLELHFRIAFGRSPAEEIRIRRLELARRLLAETSLPVASIAARVGAGSVQAFTTLFRQTFGLPPAAWRAKHER
ncbi:MAG TPA: helix-turn-helix domain-containing protein [Kiritimatiellia bacterium]|nr:helix-turn-helix domain-containing protein [Kiritimatiellia bacterium]HRU70149.1 helix-turn-helix domain-containing protein [Kiritimatiellia bacterium]